IFLSSAFLCVSLLFATPIIRLVPSRTPTYTSSAYLGGHIIKTKCSCYRSLLLQPAVQVATCQPPIIQSSAVHSLFAAESRTVGTVHNCQVCTLQLL
ncbi:hypothetical protein HHX47_DHR3001222, partial [Lentinula edodes]